MRRNFNITGKLLFITALAFYGHVNLNCASTNPMSDWTQLQIRAFQTKEFETSDFKTVLRTVVGVLMDDGYIIKNGDAELGYLTAAKDIDVENTAAAVLMVLFAGYNATWNKTSIVEATVNVYLFGEKTRVRVIFRTKTLDNKGAITDIVQVSDENFYREFFAKVDKALFLKQEKID